MRTRSLTLSIGLIAALFVGCQEPGPTEATFDDHQPDLTPAFAKGGKGQGGDAPSGVLTVSAGTAFVTTDDGEFHISRDSNKKLDLAVTEERNLRASAAMEPVPADPMNPDPLVNGDCVCWDKATDLPGDPTVCDGLLDRLTIANVDWVRVIVDRSGQGDELRVIDDGNTFQNPPGFTLISGDGFNRNNEPVEPLPANWPALSVVESPSSPTPTLPRTVTYSGGILWNNTSADPPRERTQLYCRNDHVVTVALANLP